MSDRLVRLENGGLSGRTGRRTFLGRVAGGALAIPAAPASPNPSVPADRGTRSGTGGEVRATDVRRLLTDLAGDGPPALEADDDLADRSLLVKTEAAPPQQVRGELAHLLDAVRLPRDEGARLKLSRDARARQHRSKLIDKVYSGALSDIRLQMKRMAEPPQFFQELKKRENSAQALRLFGDGNWRYLADPEVHAALELLKMLPAERLIRGMREEGIYLPYRELPPSGQRLLLKAAEIFSRPHTIHRQQLEDWRTWATSFGIVFLITADAPTGELGMFAYRVGTATMPLWYSGSAGNRRRGRILPVRGNPNSPRDRGETEWAPLERAAFPRNFTEQVLTTWSAELRRLAPLVPYRIYSEELPSSYFGVDQVGVSLNPGVESGRPDRLPLRTMSLAKGLDALCERHRRLWWPAGEPSTSGARPGTWMRRRLFLRRSWSRSGRRFCTMQRSASRHCAGWPDSLLLSSRG